MKLAMIAALAASVAGCTGTAPGLSVGLTPPATDLMIEPRRIKPLREGGDLKQYTIILASRNGELVDQVKGLQAYVATISGASIIKPGDQETPAPAAPRRTRPPSS